VPFQSPSYRDLSRRCLQQPPRTNTWPSNAVCLEQNVDSSKYPKSSSYASMSFRLRYAEEGREMSTCAVSASASQLCEIRLPVGTVWSHDVEVPELGRG
jgi:hypothetical protein